LLHLAKYFDKLILFYRATVLVKNSLDLTSLIYWALDSGFSFEVKPTKSAVGP